MPITCPEAAPALPPGRSSPGQAQRWGRDEGSSAVFCYLLKGSLILLILRELMWLNSLSPC